MSKIIAGTPERSRTDKGLLFERSNCAKFVLATGALNGTVCGSRTHKGQDFKSRNCAEFVLANTALQ
jgi:hypothetical protein